MRALATASLVTALLLSGLSGCAGPGLLKPPQFDQSEQWVQAGRKVDFAIGQTKVMIQRARGAAYLPDLYMRLGELYTDRARYAWLVAYEKHKAKGDDSKAVESPEARLLKNLAIGTYGRVLREFPAYTRADEALFLTGFEYRELGDFDKMKESYERLIATYPNSPHRLEAYLSLGDHAFDASDLPTAERYYRAILAAPISPVHPLARYKLAWVRVNQQDCRGAVTLFETTLKEGIAGQASAALLSTQKDLNVMREALVDLAYCYPEVYPDKPAEPYFRNLATSAVDYLAAMRKLANRFAIKEMQPQAAGALREVLDGMTAEEDGPELVRRLHTAVIKGSVFDAPGRDVARIISTLDARLADYRMDAAARQKLTDEFELYARDIATRAHVAAKASQSQAALSQVADAYHAYLSRFSAAPAAGDVRENWAEALLAAKRNLDAGRAYEELEAATKKPETKKLARLNAIASYQTALEDPSLGRLDRVVAWGGIRTLGRHVIQDTPSDPAIPGIKLSIARSYYETGDYKLAAELFFALARQFPTTNEGVAGANLCLDALRLADDLEGLTTLGRLLVADTRLAANVRKDLGDIVSKAAQREVAEVTASDSGDREEQLLAMAKRNKGSEVGEEAFYNTLLLAKANGEIERFSQLGDQFVTDYPTSPKRADVLTALASLRSDIGDFGRAAKYDAAAFAADPTAKDAVDRLVAAASMHAVLGDPAAADEIAKLAERGNPKVDDLLMLLARSGSLSALESVLAKTSINSPVAQFFNGYAAFRHADFPTARAALSRIQGASPDLTARARFLIGEIAFEEFKSIGNKGDLAGTIDANAKALAAVDRAYKPVIDAGEAPWAMFAVARMADADQRFAVLLRSLEPPEGMSPQDQKTLKTALAAQATEVEKRGATLKAACVKQARKGEVFSEAAKSCLLDQPLPETIPMFAQARRGGEPQGAAAVRQTLLKNPRDVNALAKLAELYLGAGDLASALLILERAEPLGGRKAAIKNLYGLTMEQLGEPQAAGDAFKEAVVAEPNDPQYHLNLAAQYAAFGYVDRAKTEMKKAGAVPSAPRGPLDHPDVGLLNQLDAKKGAP